MKQWMPTRSAFLLRARLVLCHSITSQHMTSSNLHRYPCANLHKSNGPVSPEPRVADGTPVHVRSPRSRMCLLHFNLDRRLGSCLMVDGHWRCWPDLLATSLVCSEYSRRLPRASPALRWYFTSTFTSCCATEEKSASSASGEQGVRAMTTTQARLARGGRAELESQLPLPA